MPPTDGVVYCDDADKSNYFIRKKAPDAELDLNTITGQQRELFYRKSRPKEWTSIKENGAVKMLSLKDSQKVRHAKPERILPSRWHDKWKDHGPEHDNGYATTIGLAKHLEPKSRWIVLGFHDPDIADVERTVPTPETSD
eukprot:28818-Alexandrium_andersonii.AAC.1